MGKHIVVAAGVALVVSVVVVWASNNVYSVRRAIG